MATVAPGQAPQVRPEGADAHDLAVARLVAGLVEEDVVADAARIEPGPLARVRDRPVDADVAVAPAQLAQDQLQQRRLRADNIDTGKCFCVVFSFIFSCAISDFSGFW